MLAVCSDSSPAATAPSSVPPLSFMSTPSMSTFVPIPNPPPTEMSIADLAVQMKRTDMNVSDLAVQMKRTDMSIADLAVQMKRTNENLSDQVSELRQHMDTKFTSMEKKLVNVEERLVNVEERLVNVEERLVNVEERLVNVEEKMDKLNDDLHDVNALALLKLAWPAGFSDQVGPTTKRNRTEQHQWKEELLKAYPHCDGQAQRSSNTRQHPSEAVTHPPCVPPSRLS